MASGNEELAAAPKPRASPLDYRNTDLVSRLLAATPPYLYNMPLVPHSYFFSEMLRSFVQAKTNADARSSIPNGTSAPTTGLNASGVHRRSRKRAWSHIKQDTLSSNWHKQVENGAPLPPFGLVKQTPPTHPGKQNDAIASPNWPSKMAFAENKSFYADQKTIGVEKPLELTNKITNINNNEVKILHKTAELQTVDEKAEQKNDEHNIEMTDMSMSNANNIAGGHLPFPGITPDGSIPSSDLILPPPPPIWYPSLYPTPYGIDPLHFFIDLRVSGHIYDRKNAKEINSIPNQLSPSAETVNPININITNDSSPDPTDELTTVRESLIKQTRHASAFSVPTTLSKKGPINLSNAKFSINKKLDEKHTGFDFKFDDFEQTYDDNSKTKPNETKCVSKFDVKSLGFDKKSENKISTNYVMQNLSDIYKHLQMRNQMNGVDDSKSMNGTENENKTGEETEDGAESIEGKTKRCKDLTALIGLELVVDYVKHERPSKKEDRDEGDDDDDEQVTLSRTNSPDLEIVECTDNI